MRKKGGKKGFTLIELALAVGFLATLSLTVVLIINDTVETYRRGITLNQINTTGMDLVDDFQAALQSSPARQPKYDCGSLFSEAGGTNSPSTYCANDNASSLISLTRYGYADTNGDGRVGSDERIPAYGAICTGSFTYIWNSGYFFGENAGSAKANMRNGTDRSPKSSGGGNLDPATFTYTGGETISDFRLLKIKDSRRGVCKTMVRKITLTTPGGGATGAGGRLGKYLKSADFEETLWNNFNVTDDHSDSGFVDYFPQQLTKDKDIEVVLDDSATNPLALYDFSITTPVTISSGEAAFYSSSFILGTITGGIDVKAKGNFCKTPEDYEEDFDYCAINKFNFAAQATGG